MGTGLFDGMVRKLKTWSQVDREAICGDAHGVREGNLRFGGMRIHCRVSRHKEEKRDLARIRRQATPEV